MKNKHLKILMLTEYFMPFDRGGSEWSVFYLAKALIKKGIKVSIFTPNYGASSRQTIDQIDIYRFPFFPKLKHPFQTLTPFWHSNLMWWITTSFILVLEAIKNKPTHLHVQGKYFLPAAILIGKLFKIPVITTLRDYIILCPFAYCINKKSHWQACSFKEIILRDMPRPANLFTFFSAIRGFIMSLILKFFLKKSSAIVAVSSKLAQIYQINCTNIHSVIYNTCFFFRKRIGKPQDYLLFVGRLTQGKGVDLLVKAYSQLRFKSQMPVLKIIGTGPLRKDVLGRQDKNIELLGQLSYQQTLKYISQARLVIVPSVWEEPFGRVALEALSYGVPVLASNQGALPEIVNHGYGIVVNPTETNLTRSLKDALEQNQLYRKNIIKDWIKLEKKFSSDPVKQYINLYHSLME